MSSSRKATLFEVSVLDDSVSELLREQRASRHVCYRIFSGVRAARGEYRTGVVMDSSSSAMTKDVAEWLRGLGLEQYAPAFRDNDIDGEVLRRLAADDLRDLGVTSVGHRRLLLDAIAALRDAQRIAEASLAPVAAARVIGAAERRQLTVMFIDLAHSSVLAQHLDPEELGDVIGAYHRCVAEAVGRFDGFLAKYLGDGVLTYFGYPVAH